MMIPAVKGKINGNTVMLEDNVKQYDGYNVIVTILNTPYEPVSKERVLADILASKTEFDCGQGQDARQAVEEIRAEFHI